MIPDVDESLEVNLEENVSKSVSQEPASMNRPVSMSENAASKPNEAVAIPQVHPRDVLLPSESDSSDTSKDESIESVIKKIENLSVNPKKRNRASELKNLRFSQDKLNEMCNKNKLMKLDELSDDERFDGIESMFCESKVRSTENESIKLDDISVDKDEVKVKVVKIKCT